MHRRTWLKWAAGAGAAAAGGIGRGAGAAAGESQTPVTMDQLEEAAAQPVLKTELLPDPVIIDSFQLLRVGRDVVLRVRSKDGAEGVAFTNGRAGYLHPILNQRVAPYFVGKDARLLEDHLWGVYRHSSNYKMQGLAFWCPVAWVELALLDMLGRVANRSIGELLGEVIRRRIAFYVASGRRDTTPEEEVDYLRGLIEETGAKAVKFRLGGRMSRNEDAMPGRTERLIPLVRKTFGDAIDIHGDANSSYDPPHAINIGRLLEENQAVYFEEPCPFDHLLETKEVADALTIPVAGGEQEYSQWRFQFMIANRGVDIVQPDLHYYGGLIRSTRVARMAHLAGMPTTVHISGGFGFIYMLHFASITPMIGPYQEYKRGIERYADLFDPPLENKDGLLSVPTGPGVGVEDLAALWSEAKPFPS